MADSRIGGVLRPSRPLSITTQCRGFDVFESATEDAADNRRDGQYAESFSKVVAEIR